MKPIKSSNLIEGQRNEDGTAQVRFKNGLYQSVKVVPLSLWQQFESTFQTENSSGSFFHKNLKQFDFKKING